MTISSQAAGRVLAKRFLDQEVWMIPKMTQNDSKWLQMKSIYRWGSQRLGSRTGRPEQEFHHKSLVSGSLSLSLWQSGERTDKCFGCSPSALKELNLGREVFFGKMIARSSFQSWLDPRAFRLAWSLTVELRLQSRKSCTWSDKAVWINSDKLWLPG